MILKFIFQNLGIKKQVLYLKRNGVGLGTRVKNGRKIYVYMLRDIFVEVLYHNDNSEEAPERLQMITGLPGLNQYLEKEFRDTF